MADKPRLRAIAEEGQNPDDAPPDETAGEAKSPGGRGAALPPLLIDINGLAALLARSVPSLHRDDAAGRLPAAVRIGASKRWRYAEVTAWVAAGCPDRRTWQATYRP